MSRYIDADKLKKEGWHLVRERRNKHRSYIEGMDLDCVQTADVIEAKRGKWMPVDYAFFNDELYKCSVCGEEFVIIEGTPTDNGYKFCPNCGASMMDDNATQHTERVENALGALDEVE